MIPFSAVTAKVFAGIALALVIICLILLLWGRAGYAAADRFEALAKAEKANHIATKANFRQAQKSAAAIATALRLAHEQKSILLAERADHEKQDTIADRAAAARFAAARRVQDISRTDPRSAAGIAGAAGQADTASHPDGPGADAVALTRAEFDALVENTLRLDRLHQWGQTLIDQGLAIASPEDQQP